MKNKLLLVCLLVLSVVLQACSCDKFDINTYTSAVKNYNNSIGLDYTLDIRTTTEGSNKVVLEEGVYKYEFTPNRKVINFSSVIKKYEQITSDYGADSNHVAVYTLKRYYINETQRFYIEEDGKTNNPIDTKYEDMYDENSFNHINNIVPTFKEDDITGFNIVKDENNKGYSIATFNSACPVGIPCDNEVVSYTVTMDKDFYFSQIEFTVKDGKKTSTYTYKFNKYNNDVEVDYPNNINDF